MNGGHAMAISNLKGRSWGMTGDIVRNAVDPRDYLRYDGSEAAGLRMASEIGKRKHILLWESMSRHSESYRSDWSVVTWTCTVSQLRVTGMT